MKTTKKELKNMFKLAAEAEDAALASVKFAAVQDRYGFVETAAQTRCAKMMTEYIFKDGWKGPAVRVAFDALKKAVGSLSEGECELTLSGGGLVLRQRETELTLPELKLNENPASFFVKEEDAAVSRRFQARDLIAVSDAINQIVWLSQNGIAEYFYFENRNTASGNEFLRLSACDGYACAVADVPVKPLGGLGIFLLHGSVARLFVRAVKICRPEACYLSIGKNFYSFDFGKLKIWAAPYEGKTVNPDIALPPKDAVCRFTANREQMLELAVKAAWCADNLLFYPQQAALRAKAGNGGYCVTGVCETIGLNEQETPETALSTKELKQMLKNLNGTELSLFFRADASGLWGKCGNVYFMVMGKKNEKKQEQSETDKNTPPSASLPASI